MTEPSRSCLTQRGERGGRDTADAGASRGGKALTAPDAEGVGAASAGTVGAATDREGLDSGAGVVGSSEGDWGVAALS